MGRVGVSFNVVALPAKRPRSPRRIERNVYKALDQSCGGAHSE